LEVSESEAVIVRRVFYLFAAGLSCSEVATNLVCEEVPAPGKHSDSGRACWNSKLVHRILKNELYIGKRTWNKTSQIIYPVTGKRMVRRNAPQDWVQVEDDEPALKSGVGDRCRPGDGFDLRASESALQGASLRLTAREEAGIAIRTNLNPYRRDG
jgi:hypothetical protein